MRSKDGHECSVGRLSDLLAWIRTVAERSKQATGGRYPSPVQIHYTVVRVSADRDRGSSLLRCLEGEDWFGVDTNPFRVYVGLWTTCWVGKAACDGGDSMRGRRVVDARTRSAERRRDFVKALELADARLSSFTHTRLASGQ